MKFRKLFIKFCLKLILRNCSRCDINVRFNSLSMSLGFIVSTNARKSLDLSKRIRILFPLEKISLHKLLSQLFVYIKSKNFPILDFNEYFFVTIHFK